ncbi:MAG: hypothetical protein ABI725_01740 [Chloroflexota bacterium]
MRRELLTRQGDARSAELGQYLFVQALIREVSYNTLSRKDRKTRHLAAARFFEQLDSDELASALAGHYLAAHANAAEGPEQDALAAQARVALKAAAERASRLGAYDQAVQFLQQALSVTMESRDRAELLERASEFAGIASKHSLAVQLARDAIDAHKESGDRLGEARATSALGWVMLNARYDTDALELLKAAVTQFADLDDPLILADMKVNLARAWNQFERVEGESRALALSDEALLVAEHGNHPKLLVKGLLNKGVALGGQGRLREAIALIGAGGDLAREHGLTEQLLASLTVRGYYLGEVDNEEAYRCFLEGLDLARRVGHRALTREFVNNVGYTSFLTGDWERGLAELDATLEEDLETTGRIWLMSNQLIIRASRGDPIDEPLAQLDHLATQVPEPHVLTAPHDTHGNYAQAQGRFADAQRHWLAVAAAWPSQAPASYYQAARPALWSGDLAAVEQNSADLDATGVHGPVVEARRSNLRAAIAALEGRSRDAVALYGDAFAAWGNLKVAWEQALTGVDMATVLDPTEPAVAAAIKTSREILSRLGAKPYLERLEAAAARAGGASRVGTGRKAEALAVETA